ncbi:cytochrome P450 [Amycolatopsis rhabdoformis]|uniref:Cytochrome P450 n=1 Tax=Amycolatopsis rhabdoformis TaxID=1448059 RepID=A0ABZ1IGN8_9PSEU|nr:cytochrome P450 [Amycolatopsis rhabdoformis]WSE33092.1 cytochrome P450 [Amycolatopsis rhabdoformis]
MFETDVEPHVAWRRLLQPYFTPAAAARHEGHVRRLCRETIAGFVADGRADLVTAYTQRVPPLLIGAMLGLSDQEQVTLAEHVRALTAAGTAEAARRAGRTFADLLAGHVRDRMDHPREDMLSAVAHARVDGQVSTETELLKFAMVMVAAGHLTATDACATILLQLLGDHGLRDRCAADPAVLPAVIEESVRHEPAVAATGRAVMAETELAGVALSPGDRLLLVWGSANRDPDPFPDGDSFRLDRPRGGAPHLGWGAGAHRCLGRHAARMELRVMVEELLTAIPDLRQAPGAAPERTYGVIRGVRTLRAEWTAP